MNEVFSDPDVPDHSVSSDVEAASGSDSSDAPASAEAEDPGFFDSAINFVSDTYHQIKEAPFVDAVTAAWHDSLTGPLSAKVNMISARADDDLYYRRGSPPDADHETELNIRPEEDHGYYSWCRTVEDYKAQDAQLEQERHDSEIIARYPKAVGAYSLGLGAVEAAMLGGGNWLLNGGEALAGVAAITGELPVKEALFNAVRSVGNSAVHGARIGAGWGLASGVKHVASHDIYSPGVSVGDEIFNRTIAGSLVGFFSGAATGTVKEVYDLWKSKRMLDSWKNKVGTDAEPWVSVKQAEVSVDPSPAAKILAAAIDGMEIVINPLPASVVTPVVIETKAVEQATTSATALYMVQTVAQNLNLHVPQAGGGVKIEKFRDLPDIVKNALSFSPVTKGRFSDSPTLQLMTKLAYTSNLVDPTEAAGEVLPVSAEQGINLWAADLHKLIHKVSGSIAAARKQNPNVTYDEVCNKLMWCIRDGLHEVEDMPGLTEAATAYVEWQERLINEAVKYGVLKRHPRERSRYGSALEARDARVAGSPIESDYVNYVTTIINTQAIRDNKSEFLFLTKEKLARDNPKLSSESLSELAESFYEKFTGDDIEKLHLPLMPGAGQPDIEEMRKFLVTREDFQDFEKFTINDIGKIAQILNRKFAPLLELGRVDALQFGHLPDFHELGGTGCLLRAIKQEYATKEMEIRSRVTDWEEADKLISKLAKEYEGYGQLAADREGILTGMYGAPKTRLGKNVAPAIKTLHTLTNISHLPLVAFSALADIGNMGLKHGLIPTINSLFAGFYKKSASYLNKQDLIDLGAAGEVVHTELNSMLLANIDLVQMKGRTGEVLDASASWFMKMTGLPTINDFMGRVEATVFGTKLLRACRSSFPTESEELLMTHARIPREFRGIIAERFDKYCEMHGNAAVFNFKDWPNDEITRAVKGAINSDVKFVVLQPSRGDIPRWALTPIGKFFIQFKRFAFASMNNVLLPMLQRGRDNHIVASIALALFGSTCAVWLKSLIQGDPYELTDGELYKRGMAASDRSGIFLDVAEISTALISNRSLGDVVTGSAPAFSYAGKLWRLKNIIPKIASGKKISRYDIDTLVSLFGVTNLPYTQPITRMVTNAVGDALYLRKRKTRAERKLAKELREAGLQ